MALIQREFCLRIKVSVLVLLQGKITGEIPKHQEKERD